MEFKKITIKLFPVIYRDVFLQKKKTHVQGDMNYSEFVFYVNTQPKYYLTINDTDESIKKWADEHNVKFWQVVKKLLKQFDKNISGPPLMAVLFDWSLNPRPEDVEVYLVPIEALWQNLTNEDKEKLFA